MRNFDWNNAKEIRSPRRYEWLLENCESMITEEEFVSQNKLLKPFARGKRNNGRYTPSHLKSEYHYLKDHFGFFK